MQTNIQAILFDKDGTLFGYADTWLDWTENVLRDLSGDDSLLFDTLAQISGYDPVTKSFAAGALIVGAAVDELIAAWHCHLPDMTVEQINQIAVDHLDTVSIVPVCDLGTVLGGLQASGLILGVVTNDYEHSANAQLEAASATGYFEFVAGFDSGHGAKPGPGMIEAFCRLHNIQATSVAMVGDSTHDLLAGRAAGVGLNIAVLTGPAGHAELSPHADMILADISELPALLQPDPPV